MADPVTAEPEETRAPPSEAPVTALRLLRRHDFRNVFLAVSASEVGDALHHIALMWVAIETAAPLGVVAVRLADSVPALVFGLHGGVAADRRNRRNMTVAADLARGATLVPIAVAGLTGQLPLWGPRRRVVSARERPSHFEPAHGALVPTLVDRRGSRSAAGRSPPGCSRCCGSRPSSRSTRRPSSSRRS